MEFSQENLFPSIFGEWILADFNDDSLPDMTSDEPVYM